MNHFFLNLMTHMQTEMKLEREERRGGADPFGRLPVRHSRVMQASSDKQTRVLVRLYVIHRTKNKTENKSATSRVDALEACVCGMSKREHRQATH